MSLNASRRRWLVLAIIFPVALAVLWYTVWRKPAEPETPGVNPWRGPVSVHVVPAGRGDLEIRLKAVGTVTPLNTVTVRSRVDGPLARVHFREGQQVEKGQLLAEIDDDVYRVRLAEALGQQAQNQALLKNAESDLALYQGLFAQDSIARQQLDKQQALVNQLRGSVQADQAAVDNARLQLSWTRITAPIGGRLGLRRVDAGNLVASSDANGLVTIAQTRPLNVLFPVPEQHLADIRAAQAASRGGLAVEAWDRGETRLLATGRLTTLDNQIDTATGTLRLKAEFANADDALFPNQFVNVRLVVRAVADAITIPVDAVQYGAKGSYVYVIKDGKAGVRPLVLGPVDGERVAVSEGLAAGESVVLEGLDRLHEGREVIVVAPEPAEGGSTPAAATPAPAAASPAVTPAATAPAAAAPSGN